MCKLDKAVYGLVQASKAFYDEITKYLKNYNKFTISNIDPCLIKKTIGRDQIIGGIYVDDIIFIGKKQLIHQEIKTLQSKYELRIKEDVDEYVGCQLIHKDNSIVLHQHRLIDKMEREFMVKLSMIPKETPMPTHFHITRPEENDESLTQEELKEYQSGTGTLLYLIKHSRPDLCNSVRELTKAMDRSNKSNLEMMYRVIKYTVNTRNLSVKLTQMTHLQDEKMVLR